MTPRRPERPTTGAADALLAELAGTPLQPWQRYVADVAGELIPNPDPHPLPDHPKMVHAYNLITLSVGRRAGKSTLTFARAARCAASGHIGYYAAQNGKAGAERFRNDWVPLLARSPEMSAEYRTRLTNGTETITHTPTDGYVRIFAPIPTALHGDSGDWIAFDEAWSHTRERGSDLEVAAYPLTATRPGAQLWVMSAAGDVDSTWWLDNLDAGRDAVAANTGTGRAHFEWSAELMGDDCDLSDPDVWVQCHPAVRHESNPYGMVPLDVLRTEHARSPEQFARSWLNVNDRHGTTSSPIDANTWAMLATERTESPALVTLGVACSTQQQSTAIVAAYDQTIEVVDVRPGYDWVADRLVELDSRWQIDRVAIDVAGSSPAAVLRRPVEYSGVPHRFVTLADATSAVADLAASVRQGRLRQVPHPAFDAAVQIARRRAVGDGAWLWHRDAGDVAVLEAAGLARWVSTTVHALPTPAIG